MSELHKGATMNDAAFDLDPVALHAARDVAATTNSLLPDGSLRAAIRAYLRHTKKDAKHGDVADEPARKNSLRASAVGDDLENEAQRQRDALSQARARLAGELSRIERHYGAGAQAETDAEQKPTDARKDDDGKAPWSLLPYDSLGQVVEVLRLGAKKHGTRNWERGMDYGDHFDAAMRHLTAWHRRDERDPESSLSHLAHAACRVLFLLAYEMRGVGRDDRPGKESKS